MYVRMHGCVCMFCNCNCSFIGATIYINIVVARTHQVDLWTRQKKCIVLIAPDVIALFALLLLMLLLLLSGILIAVRVEIYAVDQSWLAIKFNQYKWGACPLGWATVSPLVAINNVNSMHNKSNKYNNNNHLTARINNK